jgi:hypothetical protein
LGGWWCFGGEAGVPTGQVGHGQGRGTGPLTLQRQGLPGRSQGALTVGLLARGHGRRLLAVGRAVLARRLAALLLRLLVAAVARGRGGLAVEVPVIILDALEAGEAAVAVPGGGDALGAGAVGVGLAAALVPGLELDLAGLSGDGGLLGGRGLGVRALGACARAPGWAKFRREGPAGEVRGRRRAPRGARTGRQARQSAPRRQAPGRRPRVATAFLLLPAAAASCRALAPTRASTRKRIAGCFAPRPSDLLAKHRLEAIRGVYMSLLLVLVSLAGPQRSMRVAANRDRGTRSCTC